jgi:hypothetical protein
MCKTIQLAKILGTDLLQLAASFLPESERSHDFADIVRDLQEISVGGTGRFTRELTLIPTFAGPWAPTPTPYPVCIRVHVLVYPSHIVANFVGNCASSG